MESIKESEKIIALYRIRSGADNFTKNEPKLTLNIRTPALQKRGSNNGESLRKAAEVRKLHNETYDEAWARILAMKNSPRDDERLREVKRAMDEGKIGRSEEHTSELQSRGQLVCRLLLE